MIDVHAATVAIHDANLTGGKQAAIRATTEVLADCWDDCIDSKPGDPIRDANPYRLALKLTPEGPHAPRVESVDEPDDDTEASNGIDGVWVVWRAHGDRSKGFTAIYPDYEELEALRQVNADGFGVAEFIPFGVQIA